MTVYAIELEMPFNTRKIICCSNSEQSLKDYIKNRELSLQYNITVINLNFSIDDIDQICSVNWNGDNADSFYDIGQYFKNYKDAKSYIDSMSKYNNTNKEYIIENINVIK